MKEFIKSKPGIALVVFIFVIVLLGALQGVPV